MPTAPSSDLAPRSSVLASLVHSPLLAYRLMRWRAHRGGWLPGYFRQKRFDYRKLPKGRPIDIMVVTADHFEPARRFGDATAVESVRSWCDAYEQIASRHADSDGRPPQHTWF